MIRFDSVVVKLQEKILLSKVSFEILEGEKVVLIGPSGAGKSSVLRTFLGFYPLTAGQVFFKNNPLNSTNVSQMRSDTVYIGQDPVLGAATVLESLLLPFQFKVHREHKPTRQQIEEVLDRLRLPLAILNQSCQRISGGEKQRVALSRGLLLGKKIFLLDEVTSALDRENSEAVLQVFSSSLDRILDRTLDITVLSITHDPKWLDVCGVVLEMNDGKLTQQRSHGTR